MPAPSMTEPDLSGGVLSGCQQWRAVRVHRDGMQRCGALILHRMFGDLRFAVALNFLASLFLFMIWSERHPLLRLTL